MLDTVHGSLDTIRDAKHGEEPFAAKYKLQPINVNLFAKARGSLPLPRPLDAPSARTRTRVLPAASSPSFRIRKSPKVTNQSPVDMKALNNDAALAFDQEDVLGEVTPSI